MAKVVQAGADGKAPKGLAPGTIVKTNGGNYVITAVNSDGSYKSQKTDSGNTDSSEAYKSLQTQKTVSGQPGYTTYAPGVDIRDARGNVRNTGETGLTTKTGSGVYSDAYGNQYTKGDNGSWNPYQTPSVYSLAEQPDASLLDAATAWQTGRGGSAAGIYDTKYNLDDYDASYRQISQEREAARSGLVNAGPSGAITANYLSSALSGAYGAGTQAAAEAYAQQILDEEQYRKAYYANLARKFNEAGYSSIYDPSTDYQEEINKAVSAGNLGDAAIYEVLRNQKIRQQGLPMEQTYKYADWLSTGKTGNPNIVTDSHGRLLGTLDYGSTTGTEGSAALDVPIVYSNLYGPTNNYGYTVDQVLAGLDTNGQYDAAAYLRQALAEGNTAKVQAALDNVRAYNSVGNLDNAYAQYLTTGAYPGISSPGFFANFGGDTINADSATANANAVLRGLATQGNPGNAELYRTLSEALKTGRLSAQNGSGDTATPGMTEEAVAGNGLGNGLTDDYWSELLAQTDSRYQDIGQSLRDAIDAQTRQALLQINQQKEAVNNEYADLYRQAYINAEQSKRRLPQILAAQGQSGGMSESAMLQIENAYNSTLSAGEKERIRQLADLDTAIANTQLSGTIAAAQSDAEIGQAALAAYNNLMTAMRSEQLSLQQMAIQQQQWAAQMQLSREQWAAEYAMAQDEQKSYVAAAAKADLQARAELMATYGDFSAYLELGYTPEQVAKMQQAYDALLTKDTGGSYYTPAVSPIAPAEAPIVQANSNPYASLISAEDLFDPYLMWGRG